MLYNKKIKPLLIDQNIIGEYMKEKMMSQMKVSGVPQQSELQKLLTKIFYNIVNFVYHYFFILLVFIGIVYYLYKRYVWYQEIKTKQGTTHNSDKIKKYFDDIMDGNTSAKDQEQNLEIQASQASLNKLHQASHGFTNKPNQQTVQSQAYFAPSKKIDKVVSSNNGYLNHLKQSFDVAKAPTTSMGRIETNTNNKTVRFAQGDFDAYGRNNINPKTGETLVKDNVIFDDYVQAYDTKSGYSSF
jgi:hypothetical protein